MSYEDYGDDYTRERERAGINVLHEGDNMLYYKHEFQSPLLLSLFFLRILSILTHTHKKRGEGHKETDSDVYSEESNS